MTTRKHKQASRWQGLRTVRLKVTRRDDTPNGVWNGGVVFHAMEEGGAGSGLFNGCPLGRASTEAGAVADFIRRANSDSAAPALQPGEVVITHREDIATNKGSK